MADPSLFFPSLCHDSLRNAGTLPCVIDGAGTQKLATTLSALVTLAVLGWQYLTRGSASRCAALPVSAEAKPARQDLLTGLADPHALDEKLAEEWKRERRPNEPTALLLVGVDAFEALEHENGPLGSDVALLTVARALVRMLPRKADLLARYDRATFAVVLPGTDLPGALRVAARLRWAVVRLGIAHPATESGFLSASLGVVVQHGMAEDGSPGLAAAAHGALLKAQLGGADRLEYTVLGQTGDPGEAVVAASESLRLPSLRAWVPDRESTLRTFQN